MSTLLRRWIVRWIPDNRNNLTGETKGYDFIVDDAPTMTDALLRASHSTGWPYHEGLHGDGTPLRQEAELLSTVETKG